MQRLFETNENQATNALPTSVDTSIILTSAPFILYEQFKLDNNFRTNLEGKMISDHVLRTEIKSTPYQKSFELVTSTQSRVVNFHREMFFSRYFPCVRQKGST